MNPRSGKESTDGERNAVRITREFDFPRETVFRMFTDPQRAAKFWGPEGAINLVFELDPRPGGAMRILDRNTEGMIGKTSGTILEIAVPELLVFRSVTTMGEGTPPFEAEQTVTFEALSPQRTRVTALVKVLSAGSFPGGVEGLAEGFRGGWGETFDRLQRALR